MGLHLAHLTAGTGSFHCGNCTRDNTLVRALRAAGHEAYLVPLYLPLVLDEAPAPSMEPLFAGGINMFLQHKLSLFRHTPRWLDRWFDATGLLRHVSKYAGMTRARDLGEMTVEAFRGFEGRQVKEWERLISWLAPQRPQVVALSNGLLTGLARELKERLGCAVVSTLQGEDSFLDSLPEPWRSEAWQQFRTASAWVDRYVGVSEYYRRTMLTRLGLSEDKIVTVHNGIDLSHFETAPSHPEPPVIGYLARLCHGKGMPVLVDAFIELKQRATVPGLRLRLAGTKMNIDEPLIQEQERKLEVVGFRQDVDILPNLAPEEKAPFLRSLSVLSVPATYGEAFGLYVIEALACGVPVVQPDHAAFPEVIQATGGGVLCPSDDPYALASALEQTLLTPGLTVEMGRRARAVVERQFSASAMAAGFAKVCEAVLAESVQN